MQTFAPGLPFVRRTGELDKNRLDTNRGQLGQPCLR